MLSWLTDTHLDFIQNPGVRRKFFQSLSKTGFPLCITGDISDGKHLIRTLEEFSEATELPIYFVTGNHDYYFSSWENMRPRIEDCCRQHSNLFYLPVFGVTNLNKDTCIIGTDSWYDGRIVANFHRTPFALNDFNYIGELAAVEERDLPRVFQSRADAALVHLKQLCDVAVTKYKKIIILSHPIPFGRMDKTPSSLSPFYVWYDAGKYIFDFADQHPENSFLWLSGHTHNNGTFSNGNNLDCFSLGAEYGYPKIGATVNSDLTIDFV